MKEDLNVKNFEIIEYNIDSSWDANLLVHVYINVKSKSFKKSVS